MIQNKCTKWLPYYLNDYKNKSNDSNFSQTWAGIAPFLDRLNAIGTKPIVTLTRFRDDGVQTLGDLTTDGFSAKTLERPWKQNQSNISCIPVGQYDVKMTFSPRLLKYTYEVLKVPSRSGIRIHSASFWSQLLGCIALGDSFGDLNHDAQADILNSKSTVNKFEQFMQKKDFILKIQ